MQYKFRYSRLVVLVSLFTFPILCVGTYFLLSEPLGWITYFIVPCLLVLMWSPIAAMPLSLELDAEGIRLRRLLWTSYYSREEYEIDEECTENLARGLRVFASSGYFGFVGRFWTPSRGTYTLIQTEYTKYYLRLIRRKTGQRVYIAVQPQ